MESFATLRRQLLARGSGTRRPVRAEPGRLRRGDPPRVGTAGDVRPGARAGRDPTPHLHSRSVRPHQGGAVPIAPRKSDRVGGGEFDHRRLYGPPGRIRRGPAGRPAPVTAGLRRVWRDSFFLATRTRRVASMAIGMVLLTHLLPASSSLAAAQPDGLARVVAVTDGDTLTVEAAGARQRVRLYGIDAPETGQPHGDASRQSLAALVQGKAVELQVVGTDRHGRTVARVFVDGVDANLAMVQNGWAWHARRYDIRSELKEAEAIARGARRGLWADRTPVQPWEWRRSRECDGWTISRCRAQTARTQPPGARGRLCLEPAPRPVLASCRPAHSGTKSPSIRRTKSAPARYRSTTSTRNGRSDSANASSISDRVASGSGSGARTATSRSENGWCEGRVRDPNA